MAVNLGQVLAGVALSLAGYFAVGQFCLRPTAVIAQETVPKKVCTGGFGPSSCENSKNLCKLTTQGGVGGTLTLTDSNRSVRSDGRGPYANGSANAYVVVGAVAALLLGQPRDSEQPPRSFSVDLDHPVRGGGGKRLGIITDDGVWKGPNVEGDFLFNEIAAQWKTDADYTQHSLLDIPVGSTVKAAQIDLDFHIKGVHHVLQMGPQPVGHCFSDGTAIHGRGTTRGTISRPRPNQWIVDLPPGSIGRLFDDHIQDKYAVDRGLYFVSLHFVLQR